VDPEVGGRSSTSASGKVSGARLHGADAALLEPRTEGTTLLPGIEVPSGKN